MFKNKIPVCPFCGHEIILNEREAYKGFKDEASLKEFEDWGLCQTCQDDFKAGG